MTTLVLQAAGSALGSAVGGPIGAAVGRVAGALAGSALDGALFGTGEGTRVTQGPRLSEMEGLGSTEGAPIPRVYGRARVGGQLIWATRFEEVASTSVERSGRSGGKSLGSGGKTVSTTYAYFANLAVGLCEGPIALVRRVWADGRELDLTTLTMRLHRGALDQAPDPLIVAKEGAENAPAYGGLAYVVFERLPLAGFGNRVPQFSFEVVRPVGSLAEAVRAVCLIPGAGEFAYDTKPVSRLLGLGASAPENVHQLQRDTDMAASLDALQALCPNVGQVSLVVSWFGDDLRAGQCTVAPRVDRLDKVTVPEAWSVAGLARAEARLVSTVEGAAAYGGTPSDASTVRAIQDLKARGLAVVLYPFVMMDVPQANDLPDPWSGAPGQPPYPWRGRITCDPAPGRPGSPDGTAAAEAQVAAFFGTAAPGDFAVSGTSVTYSGPAEWSFRRMVLHMAHLAKASGGVDGFVIGSELVGLTRVRGAGTAYPAVTALAAIAADVRAVLGPETKLTYAADWTEYGAHVRDGGASLSFPLDPLWAHPAIDSVGIDFYPPLSDWRDGPNHLDRAEARGPADPAYLQRRVAAGEAFDWYYASPADRLAQARIPITDGAYDQVFSYRAKDLKGWWERAHVERLNGAVTGPTPWVPQSKPIWLTEIGVPAVDKGPNGPNVFPDPKSSESALPPFSRGARDDLIQVRAIEAIIGRFDPARPGFVEADNPVSALNGQRMVDPARTALWAWDARPFPAFPDFDLVWADAANWQTGHWITGRVEGMGLDRLVAAILADLGLEVPDDISLDAYLDGYVLDRPMSARDALEPLGRLYGFDALMRGGTLALVARGAGEAVALDVGSLVEEERGPRLKRGRAQETELPAEVEVGFTDGEGEYRRAAVGSRRLATSSRRQARADLAVVTRRAEAQRLADAWLQDLWARRETAEFALSPRRLDLEVGDVVALPGEAGPALHRVERIADGPTRAVTTRAVEPAVFATPAGRSTPPRRPPPPVPGQPTLFVLDLPARGTGAVVLQSLAVAADPWPGAMGLWRSGDGGVTFDLHEVVQVPALVGRTLAALGPGPVWRWDALNAVEVELSGNGLAAISDEAALAGGNLLAIQGADGAWEVVSVAQVELVGPRRVRLSRLLRGLGGTEALAGRVLPAGAPVVVLDEAIVPLAEDLSDLGRPWRYRVGSLDRGPGDPAAVAFDATPEPLALKPLAPVHLSARRMADGVRVSFVRRGRLDADGWEAEIPLGEEREAYLLEILSGTLVRRTLSGETSTILYPAAHELIDFGAPQTSLAVRVSQISAAVGPGLPATAVLPVVPG
ncbi:MAG TPA: glycoside hydrolase/phage tail family protein [Beijerinckiaceae bacterium]|jgi:hypothetical protein